MAMRFAMTPEDAMRVFLTLDRMYYRQSSVYRNRNVSRKERADQCRMMHAIAIYAVERMPRQDLVMFLMDQVMDSTQIARINRWLRKAEAVLATKDGPFEWKDIPAYESGVKDEGTETSGEG